MWRSFRDNPDAEVILSDFAICDRRTAQKFIAQFWVQYEADTLNVFFRGKADRDTGS